MYMYVALAWTFCLFAASKKTACTDNPVFSMVPRSDVSATNCQNTAKRWKWYCQPGVGLSGGDGQCCRSCRKYSGKGWCMTS